MSPPLRRGCATCRHFAGQRFEKRAGWKRAAGRCQWPVPEAPALPDSITRSHLGKMTRDLERAKGAVWPDDGETCPTWEAAQ